jgi:hypothetical protein
MPLVGKQSYTEAIAASGMFFLLLDEEASGAI